MPAESVEVIALIEDIQSTVDTLKDQEFPKTPVVRTAPRSTIATARSSNPTRRDSLTKWMYSLEQGLNHTDPKIDPKTAINIGGSQMLATTGLQLALMGRMVEQAWVLSDKRDFPAQRMRIATDLEQVIDAPAYFLGDRASSLVAFFRSFEPIANPVTTAPDKVEGDPQKPDHPYDATKLQGLLNRCSLFYIHAEELDHMRDLGFAVAREQVRDRLKNNKGLSHDNADFLAYYTVQNAGLSRIAAEEMLKDTFRVNKQTEELIFKPFGTIVELSAYEIMGRRKDLLSGEFQFSRVLTGINSTPVAWENIVRHPLTQQLKAA